MKFAIFYLLVLIFSSCGVEYKDNKTSEDILIGEELELSSNVSSEALANARSICDMLRSKRIKLVSQVSAASYQVSLKTKACGGNEVNNPSSVKITSNPQYQVTGEMGMFNRYIETDIDGHFAQVCSDVFAGLEPHLINYINSQEVIKIYIDSKDKFSIVYGKKNDQGVYLTNDIEIFYFDTESSAKRFGMNRRYVKKGQCNDPKFGQDFYLKEQEIL